MIGKMAKVEILGVKDVFLDTVDAIHEVGTLHIEDLSEKIQLMDTKRVSRMEMDPRFAEHESSLVNLRQKVADMIQELKLPIESIPRDEVARIYDTIWSDNVEVTVSKVESIIGDVEGATKGLVDQKQNLEVELSRLEKYAPIMQKVQPLADRVARMENMASIALIIERKYKAILNYLNDEISKITGGECEVVSADVDEESTAALVVFNRRYLKQVHDFLAVQNVPMAAVFFALSGVFDLIDGYVAKKLDMVTKFGSFLDSFSDRISDAAIFTGLMVYYLKNAEGLYAGLALVCLVLSFLISYTRAKAESLGFSGKAGLMSRAPRLLGLGFGLFFNSLSPWILKVVLWVLAALLFETLAERFVSIWRVLQE